MARITKGISFTGSTLDQILKIKKHIVNNSDKEVDTTRSSIIKTAIKELYNKIFNK